jgi:site-specific DNA recombinase
LIERVQLHGAGLDIRWRDEAWQGLGADVTAHPLVEESRSSAEEALA